MLLCAPIMTLTHERSTSKTVSHISGIERWHYWYN